MKQILLNAAVLFLSTLVHAGSFESRSPDFNYSVDNWVVKDLDYGNTTISRINYGEPVMAPYALTAYVSCFDPDDYEKNPKITLQKEMTVCDYEGYAYNKANQELTIRYKPLVEQKGSQSCGPSMTVKFQIKKYCRLYREPASTKKKSK